MTSGLTKLADLSKWDRRFLALAKHISSWSYDPSTKVGAVIARGKEIVSIGFNGFARGLSDCPELYADRDTKLKRTVHGEINAILHAKGDVSGCSLYTWPFMTCSRCAVLVIEAGIVRHVAPVLPEGNARWADDIALAQELHKEAGTELVIVEGSLSDL